jgi:DNA (cytosine-5)-methyltransferase 1
VDDLTHASFFSGVGGLDLGLERAGWRTVSFSEIDPYASAVLAQRWPGVPNLGDITDLARRGSGERRGEQLRQHADGVRPDGGSARASRALVASGAATATLWTGGFPCQDLSVAGRRRGMGAGTRSGLAFAFLDLAAVHRPRFILLENVPGLLSSHGGRDMAALLGALVELGYGVGYRVLDARHFGVPQRRRRVFILGVTPGGRAGAEFAAEVLSVGSRCRRHPPTGVEAGEGAAGGADDSIDVVSPLDTALGHHGAGWPDQSVAAGHLLGASPDPDRVRAADGLARRLDDRGGVAIPFSEVAGTVLSPNGGNRTTDLNNELVAHYRKSTRAASAEHDETWVPDDTTNTLNGFDVGDARAVELVTGPGGMTDDPLLPLGLDSHRYRCCGNGVVADVAEWIGYRLAGAL